MLRVILGSAGVALIALGVFGGQSLEMVHTRLSDVLDPQPSGNQVAVGSTESPVEQALVVESVAEPVEAKLESPVLVEQTVVQPAERTEQVQVAAEQSTDTAQDEPLASAASVSEVPASARNKEVAVARALLNGGVVKQGKSPLKTVALSSDKSAGNESPTDETLVAGDKQDGVADVIQSTSGGPDNKTLVVLRESVNLRQGPSTDHAVVLELAKGQELMEFKRDGKWVHVGAYGTAGKIGWVHGTLVGAN